MLELLVCFIGIVDWFQILEVGTLFSSHRFGSILTWDQTRNPSLTLTDSWVLMAWMELLIFFWCPTRVIPSSTN